MDANVLGRAAITFAFLVASLGVVTWRQSRAFEAHRSLADLRRQVSVVQAERVELERDIQVLLSRAHILPEAEALGLHTPSDMEQVIVRREGDS
jgi:cell division protein FtsL